MMPKPKPCPNCGGAGTCPNCGGGWNASTAGCTACDGTGTCQTCGGSGDAPGGVQTTMPVSHDNRDKVFEEWYKDGRR